jgi:hypothetical protein
VSTTDADLVTLWLETRGATHLTRTAAEALTGLLMWAVRELGG